MSSASRLVWGIVVLTLVYLLIHSEFELSFPLRDKMADHVPSEPTEAF